MSDRPVPPPSPDGFARRMAESVAARVGAARYAMWFASHTAFVPAGRELLVGVPTPYFQEWLSKTFGDAVHAAAAEVLGAPIPVRFVVDAGLFGESPQPTSASKPAPETFTKETPSHPAQPGQPGLFGDKPIPHAPRPKRAANLDPPDGPRTGNRTGRRWKSLDDFVVGPSNRVAHASAVGVVEDPGMGANPLVFHGPVGTGKTHLLEGITAGLRKHHPDFRPCYATAEEFTTKFVQSARFGKQGAFRRQFRD
ncbi:MAG: DnaA ATPase domain-containing protein, partial [Fimbriiglobus sp.]